MPVFKKAKAKIKEKAASYKAKRSAKKATKSAKKTENKAVKSMAKGTYTARKITPAKAAPVSRAKKVAVAKTIKKVKTQRGTGNTYKATWEANKGGVQKKYKSYDDFRKAAVAYNSRKDSKGVMAPKKSKAGPKNKK